LPKVLGYPWSTEWLVSSLFACPLVISQHYWQISCNSEMSAYTSEMTAYTSKMTAYTSKMTAYTSKMTACTSEMIAFIMNSRCREWG